MVVEKINITKHSSVSEEMHSSNNVIVDCLVGVAIGKALYFSGSRLVFIPILFITRRALIRRVTG